MKVDTNFLEVLADEYRTFERERGDCPDTCASSAHRIERHATATLKQGRLLTLPVPPTRSDPSEKGRHACDGSTSDECERGGAAT